VSLYGGPTLADAWPNARGARGPSEQWCYDVIVLSQPCYDLFDDVLAKQLLYMNTKTDDKLLELICIFVYQQFLFLEGRGTCVP